jgi:hypothetical protein
MDRLPGEAMNIRLKTISQSLPAFALPRPKRHEFRRLVEMCGMAAGVGVLGGGAAFMLQNWIMLATNLFFFGRFSLAP